MKKDLRAKESPSELSAVIAKSKRKLLTTLLLSSIACSALTVFAPLEGELFYSDVLAIITSGSAVAMSIQIIYRQKMNGLYSKLYTSLGLGVALWFIAESIWVYYELVAVVETPMPSIADAFWLAGYFPFFYFLLGILKNFVGASKSLFVPLLLISSIGLLLLANIVFSIYQAADLTSQEGIITYLVSSAYPVADMFLIVPATAAFIRLRKGKLTFTPWAFIVIATIIFIIADIGYAYFTVIGLDDIIWIWNPLYNMGYLAIASSLFWHKAFFTVDEKKLVKAWQEKNR